MLPLLALLTLQAPAQRIEGFPPDLESLGYSVAVVRDPEQRKHVELAIGAPRFGHTDPSGGDGTTFLVDLSGRRVVERRDGTHNSGLQAEWLGDVDGDHKPDFAIFDGNGEWWARSSGTTTALWSHPADAAWCFVGATSVRDTDGDGVRELAVVVRSRPWEFFKERAPAFRFELWSGSTGRVLRRVELPSAMYVPCAPVEVGDLDGDGRVDFALLSDPSALRGTRRVDAWIVPGRETTELVRVPIDLAIGEEQFTSDANLDPTLGTGDLNGDGCGELLVGVVAKRKDSEESGGLVVAFDLRRRSRVWTYVCGAAPRRSICAAVGGSDVNGDGKPDVLVRDVGDRHLAPSETQRLIVLSGADGKQIREHAGGSLQTEFPRCAAFVSDLDADGVDEYLTTETCGYFDIAGAREKVRVFSGRTGAELLRFP